MAEPQYGPKICSPHWFVLSYSYDLGDNLTSIVALCTPQEQRARDHYDVLRRKGDDVDLLRVEQVYITCCGICGDNLHHGDWRFRSWDDLVDDIATTPGWTVDDGYVYCPKHRPDKESVA